MEKWILTLKFIGSLMAFGFIGTLAFIMCGMIIWAFDFIGGCDGSSPCSEGQESQEAAASDANKPQTESLSPEERGSGRQPGSVLQDQGAGQQLENADGQRAIKKTTCDWMIGDRNHWICGKEANHIQKYLGIGSDTTAPANRSLCDFHWEELNKCIDKNKEKESNDAPKI